MDKIIYLALGIVLMISGSIVFFMGISPQEVVIGFSLVALGAVIVGWNLPLGI